MKGTQSQRDRAQKVADAIEEESRDDVSTSIDDWNEYGGFQIVVGYPRGEDPNLRSLTPAIKRAVRGVEGTHLDTGYGEHNNGIEHPEKPESWGTYRRRYSMVHIRAPEKRVA